jgi:hypothetical protein
VEDESRGGNERLDASKEAADKDEEAPADFPAASMARPPAVC